MPKLISGGRAGSISYSRMPQIRHMKEIFRSGLNPASGSIPAGTRVKIVNKPRAKGR